MIHDRTSPGSVQATLNLVEELKAELRGFEGALARMLRNEGYWFMRLGSMIERGDATARLLDVKYYLLLPAGPGGGRRARPRPVDDDPPDRLGQDRLPPPLPRGAAGPGWSPTC